MIFQFSDGEFSDPIATSLKMWKKIPSPIHLLLFSAIWAPTLYANTNGIPIDCLLFHWYQWHQSTSSLHVALGCKYMQFTYFFFVIFYFFCYILRIRK